MGSEIVSTTLTDIKSEKIHWLWEKRIPLGKLTILDGDPGLGKSLLTLDLAARVTRGTAMPDSTAGILGKVALIVRHLNKGGSENPLYRGSGSIGIIARVRNGLLAMQHPSDENKRLLVSIKNNLSEKADNLVYQVVANDQGIPRIQWLGANHDPVASLMKGSTPLSLERQEILKVLQAEDRPLGPKELAQQTGQNHTLLRQLLRRMLNAGDIVSPAYGLYTVHRQPSPEAQFPHVDAATPTTPATLATLPHHTPVRE